MKRSTDRILTTHTGSLPRAAKVIELLLAERQNRGARKAELSADRAGLLCAQDLDPCVRTFMKLAGGSKELYAEMDREEFIRQIHAFEDADRSALNRAYKVLLTAGQSHPYAILRAKELDEWHAGGFQEVMTARGATPP